MSDNKVPFIKSSAKISVEFGTDFINRIQNVYSFLLEGKTKEDADALRLAVESKAPLSSWQMSVVTMTSLVTTIHQLAKESGQIELKDMEEGLSA